MADYLVIYGNEIKADLTKTANDITAFPLLPENLAVSVINVKHINSLLTWVKNNYWAVATRADVIAALGLTDKRLE